MFFSQPQDGGQATGTNLLNPQQQEHLTPWEAKFFLLSPPPLQTQTEMWWCSFFVLNLYLSPARLSKEFIIITVLVVRECSSVSWSASHGHCWLQGPFLSVFTLMTFPVYLKSEIFMCADDNVPLFAANVSFSLLKRSMWPSSLIIGSTSSFLPLFLGRNWLYSFSAHKLVVLSCCTNFTVLEK